MALSCQGFVAIAENTEYKCRRSNTNSVCYALVLGLYSSHALIYDVGLLLLSPVLVVGVHELDAPKFVMVMAVGNE